MCDSLAQIKRGHICGVTSSVLVRSPCDLSCGKGLTLFSLTVCRYLYLCVCVCVYIYIYIYIYVYVYADAYKPICLEFMPPGGASLLITSVLVIRTLQH